MKLYNKLLENVVLPAGDMVLRTAFMQEIRKWRGYAKLSADEIDALSRRNLQDILHHAVDNIPYYQDIKKQRGNPREWLKSFPVMYKKEINAHIDSLVMVPKETLVKGTTSGSSGTQVSIYATPREISVSQGIQTHWWEWSGYYLGKKLVQTGMGRTRGIVKKMKDVLLRTKYVNSFAMYEPEVAQMLSGLSGKSGYTLGGFPSSLSVFAQVAEKYGLDDVRFDQAISWGDKLFDQYEENIERVFGCPVFDTYGCSEGIMMAAKKDLDYYYIMTPHVHMEIVDDRGNEVPDGQMGHVLLTRLDGYSMPLIRYHIGDMAVKLPREKYPEHRELNYPLLERVVGRDTDVIKVPSGKYMTVHFFTSLFRDTPDIVQFRVVQKTPGEIEIEYIAAESFDPRGLEQVENKINARLGEKYSVKWKKVDHIPPTASGKPQIVQSLIR